MLPFFKLGVGGPVAGGEQYMPWIHVDDVVGLYARGARRRGLGGPVNASAPEPVTNKAFSKALGRALHRPAARAGARLRGPLLYGEMAEIVTKGQRVVPRRAQELGYTFAHPDLDEALRSALELTGYLLMAVPRAAGSAASPVISASRGFWRRCQGLRSFHSAVASFGGIDEPDHGPRTLRMQARAEARPSRRSPSSATALPSTIALSSQM